MKWFRFWNETINDVKILQLSDYEYRIWTYLLSYASETDSTSGRFQITFKLLSLHFHQRFNLFSRAIETFQRVGLITMDEGGFITITSWNKRQFPSDNVYARVKKHREVTTKRNVSVTAPETETETETENTPIAPKKRGQVYSSDFLSFYESYPRKVAKDAAWKAWQKRNGDRPEVCVLISAIENQKKSEQWQKDNGQFIPHPATWLNQGRWSDVGVEPSPLTGLVSDVTRRNIKMMEEWRPNEKPRHI